MSGISCTNLAEMDALKKRKACTIQTEYSEGLKIISPATKIGNNLVAEFEDSEGNHIELTTSIG